VVVVVVVFLVCASAGHREVTTSNITRTMKAATNVRRASIRSVTRSFQVVGRG
jgi:hypothetical protein